MHGTLRNLADVRLRVIAEHRGSHFVYPIRLLVLVTRFLCLCWIEADSNSKNDFSVHEDHEFYLWG